MKKNIETEKGNRDEKITEKGEMENKTEETEERQEEQRQYAYVLSRIQ